jgi:hypothetical protein
MRRAQNNKDAKIYRQAHMVLWRRLAWGAVALHFAQAVLVCALTMWLDTTHSAKLGVFPLTKTVHVWRKNATATAAPMAIGFFIEAQVEPAGTLDTRW